MTRSLLPLLPLCFFLPSCQTTQDPTAHAESGYLSSYQSFEKNKKSLVYQGESDSLEDYDSIFIEEVRVLAVVDGDRKRDVRADEAEELAAIFRTTLESEFADNSPLEVVQSKGGSTLALRVGIVDLEANSPAWFVAGYAPGMFVATSAFWAATGKNPGSGVVTIQGEVLDSVTRERIYALIDQDRGGKLEVIGGLSRWGQTEKSFEEWAEAFRLGLFPETTSAAR